MKIKKHPFAAFSIFCIIGAIIFGIVLHTNTQPQLVYGYQLSMVGLIVLSVLGATNHYAPYIRARFKKPKNIPHVPGAA